MIHKDNINKIPENWQSLIDQSELAEEIQQVNSELTAFAGLQLDIENPNPDEVIKVCAHTWNTSPTEVKNSWQAIIRLRVITRLFKRHYGHLFPEDENGEIILGPEALERIYRG